MSSAFTPKKHFLLKKVEDYKSAAKKIEKVFTDPLIFLRQDSSVIVGKVTKPLKSLSRKKFVGKQNLLRDSKVRNTLKNSSPIRSKRSISKNSRFFADKRHSSSRNNSVKVMQAKSQEPVVPALVTTKLKKQENILRRSTEFRSSLRAMEEKLATEMRVATDSLLMTRSQAVKTKPEFKVITPRQRWTRSLRKYSKPRQSNNFTRLFSRNLGEIRTNIKVTGTVPIRPIKHIASLSATRQDFVFKASYD